jgi:hypothetical protein
MTAIGRSIASDATVYGPCAANRLLCPSILVYCGEARFNFKQLRA